MYIRPTIGWALECEETGFDRYEFIQTIVHLSLQETIHLNFTVLVWALALAITGIVVGIVICVAEQCIITKQKGFGVLGFFTCTFICSIIVSLFCIPILASYWLQRNETYNNMTINY